MINFDEYRHARIFNSSRQAIDGFLRDKRAFMFENILPKRDQYNLCHYPLAYSKPFDLV
jgi:hypothetical protein